VKPNGIARDGRGWRDRIDLKFKAALPYFESRSVAALALNAGESPWLLFRSEAPSRRCPITGALDKETTQQRMLAETVKSG
jgi:hypothetical protein